MSRVRHMARLVKFCVSFLKKKNLLDRIGIAGIPGIWPIRGIGAQSEISGKSGFTKVYQGIIGGARDARLMVARS
jgi:hypothetical protein